MSFSDWLITGAIFIIILAVALGIGWWLRNRSNPSSQSPPKYSAPLVWTNIRPGPNPSKNFCQLYDFPTVVLDINGVPTAIPGTPTFDAGILDQLSGMTALPRCLDTDQIVAQQLQHTCNTPPNVSLSDVDSTRCFLINGGLTGIGGTETYYSNSECLAIPSCAGELSLVSVNFQGPGPSGSNDIFCLQSQGTGQNIIMALCDPSNSDQLFRVTRINPGQNPNAIPPQQGQNGLIAQILHRETGQCVLAGTGTTSTLYDPSYLTPFNTSCTGPIESIAGRNVILGTCTGGSFPGYVWSLFPSISYCGISGGCSGCRGCLDCERLPNSNVCGGCTGCTGFAGSPTPPQISYIGDLNINDIPVGPTGYSGLTGASAIFKWLIDNNTESLYYGGTGDGLILRFPIGLDVTVCENKPYTAQYLNLVNYNTLRAEEVCIADGTLATLSCVDL